MTLFSDTGRFNSQADRGGRGWGMGSVRLLKIPYVCIRDGANVI